jgi:hypothetical protein
MLKRTASTIENSGRFCPELESQCRHDFEAEGVTPLFFGQERGTSIVIVIDLVMHSDLVILIFLT